MVYSNSDISHIHLTMCLILSPANGETGYFPCAPSDWTLLFVRHGVAHVSIFAQTVLVHGGEFLLLSPHSCHSVYVEANSQLTVCSFEGLTAPPPESFCLFSREQSAPVLPMFSFLETKTLTKIAQDHMFQALLAQLISFSGFGFTTLSASSLPLQVLRYINEHYFMDLSLHDLVEVFHVSSSHIFHIFNPLFGISPIQYLIRRRIGEAQLQLRCTEKSASEIATQVGMANRNYFYRTFKRLTKLSPGQYRSTICYLIHNN